MNLAPALTVANNTLIGVAAVLAIVCMIFWLFGRR